MAGSRLEKFGTVFTRVRDLMRSGVVKQKDKPIWYDVYTAFPPKRDPLYVKPQIQRYGKVTDTVPEIFYKEDAVRAKFYEMYGNGPKAFDLSKANFISTCQRFVEKYYELQSQGQLEGDALFEEAGRALLAEGIVLRRRGSSMVAPEDRDPVLEMKLTDMLAEQQADAPGTVQTEGEQTHEQTPATSH
ncbi:28S ribosomal protein S23, mitochondrial [Megalops cyprinoides]|uniref:28S ribosomal protein S23, mitochondrial n=1 Tax=Megalops cyprinoides TaxID=118141 RepID=UPI0018641121|nr:28S ribosomal protein S23, mitochondrial [Megalops cyprinoides]XP_036393161.1 28S ribosomal protein S23, mitochondrial [Megalops cyprinoides]